MKILNCILFCMLLAGVSCLDNVPGGIIPLEGTIWKVVGSVDVETGVLTEIVPTRGHTDAEGRFTDGEPFDCEKCYTLTFGPFDSDFPHGPPDISSMNPVLLAHGWSVVNEKYVFFFEPIQITSTNIPFARKPLSGGTEAGESPTPSRYTEALARLTSYIYDNNELKLFYNNDTEYLLFKPQQP